MHDYIESSQRAIYDRSQFSYSTVEERDRAWGDRSLS